MVNFRFINAGEEKDAEKKTEMVRKVTKEEILDNLYYVPMAKNDNRGNTAVELGDIRFGYSMIKNLDENVEEISEKPYADNGSKLILMINDDAMKKYGITEDELKKNVKDFNDYKITKLSDMFGIFKSLQGEDESLPYDLSGMREIFVVFGKDGMSGANVLMSDKALSDIEERMGEGFYVLPSSIYEVLIVPKSFGSMSERELVQMVREVNANAVAEKEQLSDSIFRYEMGEIEMIKEKHREKKAPSLD